MTKLFTVLAWIIFILLLGPICFAYDLNHLVPLFTHRPLGVSFTYWPVFIGGFIFGKLAIPIAILTAILVVIGAIA